MSQTPPDHHARSQVLVDRPAVRVSKGASPHGIWWVAWRQHRLQVAVLLAVMAAGAAALIILRAHIVAVYHEFGCPRFGDTTGMGCVDAEGRQVWWNYGFSTWSQLAHLAMIAGPIVLGAFAAAPIFTREFAHGTQVLALTQSVGRGRWFAAKTTVLIVPLVGGLLALGYLMQWTDDVVDTTAYGVLNQSNFFAHAIVPAATGLMAFGLALGVGMCVRGVVATLVVGFLASSAILVGAVFVQPHLLPPDRTVTSLADIYQPVTQAQLDAQRSGAATDVSSSVIDRNVLWLGGGYLDASGKAISLTNAQSQACYVNAQKAGDAAARAAGLKPDESSGTVGVVVGGSGGTAVAQPASGFQDSAVYINASSRAQLDCMAGHGIVASYTDQLPGSKLWPLRWAIGGILLGLAVGFIAASAWRLRWAVAKR